MMTVAIIMMILGSWSGLSSTKKYWRRWSRRWRGWRQSCHLRTWVRTANKKK